MRVHARFRLSRFLWTYVAFACAVGLGICILPSAWFRYRWRVGADGERRALLRSLVSRGGPECIAQMEDIARQGDMFECIHVAETLFSLGKESGRPALLRMLRCENPNARCRAAIELASTLESSDLREVRSLLDDADADVRLHALRELVSAGDTALVPSLIELIKDDSIGSDARCSLGFLFRPLGPPFYADIHNLERSYQLWMQWWADNRETARIRPAERRSWPK